MKNLLRSGTSIQTPLLKKTRKNSKIYWFRVTLTESYLVTYTERASLPQPCLKSSKQESHFRKALHGAAILVEEEDKESPEGGLEEHPTPPGLSMRDSNESGGVKQDIEDKIPSTGHL